jgi:hypothetical protein
MRLHDERAEWKLVFAAAFVSSFGMVAAAQTPERIPLLRDISPEVITIAVYYKENVHDPADQRIGRIVDLVIKPDRTVPCRNRLGRRFLSLASKYVAAPFPALQVTQKERKPYLILDTDKKLLREAPAFEYDRVNRRWKRVEED